MPRRLTASILLIISLLLSGCGEAQRLEAAFEKARENWQAAESLCFTAEVTAELYDSVFSCTLLCTHKGGETVVEILSPENISGIRARVKEGEAQLEFDGVILAIGDPLKGEVSPLSTIPLIMSALLEGHVTLLWSEAEDEQVLTVAEIYVDEDSSLRLWFDRENFTLTHGELVSGGRAVVKCKISDFTEE